MLSQIRRKVGANFSSLHYQTKRCDFPSVLLCRSRKKIFIPSGKQLKPQLFISNCLPTFSVHHFFMFFFVWLVWTLTHTLKLSSEMSCLLCLAKPIKMSKMTKLLVHINPFIDITFDIIFRVFSLHEEST